MDDRKDNQKDAEVDKQNLIDIMQGKVSIITPVYNGESHIFRLLDSVLQQTYPNITMYVIDDGSTDATKDVITNYVTRFKERGFELYYIYQENSGQSSALNNGLKYVDGDYMLWPDADDWYKTQDAIEIMVKALQKTGDDVGIARCQLEFIDEVTLEVVQDFAYYEHPSNLLRDSIYEYNNFLYAPIGFIVKVKFLDQFIPKREIYVDKYAGQNAQILLPYFAYSKCLTINEFLCCYLVRTESSSHRKRSYEGRIEYIRAHLAGYVETLKVMNINEDEKNEYIRARSIHYYKQYLAWDYECDNTKGFRQHYKEGLEFDFAFTKRQKKVWLWTTLFSIKSYKKVGNLMNKVQKLLLGK